MCDNLVIGLHYINLSHLSGVPRVTHGGTAASFHAILPIFERQSSSKQDVGSRRAMIPIVFKYDREQKLPVRLEVANKSLQKSLLRL